MIFAGQTASQNPLANHDFEALKQQFAHRLTEANSLDLLAQIQIVPVMVPEWAFTVQTATIHTATIQNPSGDRSPLLLLHGFDSSVLEFRRLFPLLSQVRETWAIDLLGFGFSDRPLEFAINPDRIKQHLYHFWQQYLQERSFILVGASMGGAAALDFALSYPQAVEKLVLIDGAGVQTGPILGKYLFPPLDTWAVEFLRRSDVRQKISRNAYADPDRFVTLDAEACAALHLEMPRWAEALKSFTKSGGYPSFRSHLSELKAQTLILWGRYDRILGLKDATVLAENIPHATLKWIDDSGHVPHLEQPEITAQMIVDFIQDPDRFTDGLST
jgi:pimeloyl-ACP methyl ester carboxylesterase